jgi:hypothetical protein
MGMSDFGIIDAPALRLEYSRRERAGKIDHGEVFMKCMDDG